MSSGPQHPSDVELPEAYLAVLPADLAARARRARIDRASPQFAAVRDELATFASSAAADADRTVATLSPTCGADPRHLDTAVNASPASRLVRVPGWDRFLWIAAVKGRGEFGSQAQLAEYLDACGRWFAATMLRGDFASDELGGDVPAHVRLGAVLEETRRVTHTLTQFTWVSHAIMSAAATVVARDPATYGPLVWMTKAVVDDTFRYMQRLVEVDMQGAPGAFAATRPGTQHLLRSLCATSDRFGAVPFADLVVTRDVETHPFVEVDGTPLPFAGREAGLGFEQAFFELARTVLPQKARSDLFEQVAAECVRRFGPRGLEPLPAPLHVAVRDAPSDPGEADFAFVNRGRLIVLGECKAYLVNRHAHTVVNAFTDDVSKAARQVLKRLDSYAAGSPLTTGDARTFTHDDAEPAPVGVVCLLHSYAATVWSSQCLDLADALQPRLAVMPIHQLVLVMSCMESVEDLRAYVAHRERLLRLGALVFDEADLLAAYLTPYRDFFTRSIEATAAKGVVPHIAPHTVPMRIAYATRKPPPGQTFTRRFIEALRLANGK